LAGSVFAHNGQMCPRVIRHSTTCTGTWWATTKRTGIPVSAMCMIGDRLYTDIALGATAGIPTTLVLSGETREAEAASLPYQPTYIFQIVQAAADYLLHLGS
ncbi:MAG TPA: HAD hydrolase-like protein, partial [Anaerolineales bacterium]|nr:HAD hydrolase-like protein [Anaerolineales bacterium]